MKNKYLGSLTVLFTVLFFTEYGTIEKLSKHGKYELVLIVHKSDLTCDIDFQL